MLFTPSIIEYEQSRHLYVILWETATCFLLWMRSAEKQCYSQTSFRNHKRNAKKRHGISSLFDFLNLHYIIFCMFIIWFSDYLSKSQFRKHFVESFLGVVCDLCTLFTMFCLYVRLYVSVLNLCIYYRENTYGNEW